MDRRKFISLSVAITGSTALLSACKNKKKIHGSIIGASSEVGHKLRNGKFNAPVRISKHQVVIIGAGISGLTAAYYLKKNGISDFVLLDLEKVPGGNSRHDENHVSAYPWGAHYIPIANNDLTEYIDFLKECNVITGFDENSQPVYNEEFLCFDPEERLYINGKWQDGIIPQFGVPDDDKKQIESFLQLVDTYRLKKGKDGKDAFAIPVDKSSKDPEFTILDTMTMEQWMKKQGFGSDYLHWYVNYCTRDDFGTRHKDISAWMGIHYFASRKGSAANALYHNILTWPEGNGFLVKELNRNTVNAFKSGCLAVEVSEADGMVRVTYLDTSDNTVKAIDASQCIIAVPQFIAARILRDESRASKVKKYFHYSPWLVANLRVGPLKERSGAVASWDNVIYESRSLGYVEATHQLLQQSTNHKNLTYYLPLTERTVTEERESAHKRTYEEWAELILKDLEIIHPNIREAVEELNVLLWGHAMVQPLPGLIHGNIRAELSASLNDTIHFAHTDVAGASIFEEAFYQGISASNKVIEKLKSNA